MNLLFPVIMDFDIAQVGDIKVEASGFVNLYFSSLIDM
jgi:hypothetical protein